MSSGEGREKQKMSYSKKYSLHTNLTSQIELYKIFHKSECDYGLGTRPKQAFKHSFPSHPFVVFLSPHYTLSLETF